MTRQDADPGPCSADLRPPQPPPLSRARSLCVCARMCPCVRVHMCGRIAVSHPTPNPPHPHTFPALHTLRNPLPRTTHHAPPRPTCRRFDTRFSRMKKSCSPNRSSSSPSPVCCTPAAAPPAAAAPFPSFSLFFSAETNTQKKESPQNEASEYAIVRAVKRGRHRRW